MKRAVIRLISETTCKIENLELKTRQQLVNKFSYDIPGARFTPSVKLGRWDGKKKFFSLGGVTYINLLPEMVDIITDAGYELELVDNREKKQDFTFEKITETSFSHISWGEGHPHAGSPIILRDYQAEAVNIFLNDLQCIQCLATGSGKSIVSGILANKCEPFGRTILIVPSKDLVRQTESDYKLLGLDVGVFFGNRKEYTKTHTICTWQSLLSLFKKTKDGEANIPFSDFIAGVVCVMVDECHLASADGLLSLLTGPMANIPIRWAFTGTIPKELFARKSLQVSIGEVVGTIKAKELQDAGVLSNCFVHIKQMVDYVEFKQYPDELAYLLKTTARLDYIAAEIQKIAKTGNTLVLIDRVEPGQYIADHIENAVFLSGRDKSSVRKEQYDSVTDSDNKLLICSYGIASTGISITKIHNLVLIEPGKSFVRVVQSIGRGLRKGHGKDYVDIYDFTSTCKFAKAHLAKRKQYYNEAQYKFSIEKVNWQ